MLAVKNEVAKCVQLKQLQDEKTGEIKHLIYL